MIDQAQRLREIVRGNGTQTLLTTPTRVIAVTSGKGGVGKTNLSVNLGIALAQLGNRVLLFDADLGLANVDVVLGLAPQYTLSHVLLGIKTMDEVIAEGPGGLKIIPSGSGDYQLANLNEQALEECLQHLNKIEEFTDIMIVDTGAGISNSVLKFVLAAEEVIIVTTPEPTAITDAYGILKMIRHHAAGNKVNLVVNMVRSETEGQQVVERLSSVSKRFLGVGIDCLGFIPYDQTVSKAIKAQQPFMVSQPRALVSQSVRILAEKLLHHENVAKKGSRDFFERLFKKM